MEFQTAKVPTRTLRSILVGTCHLQTATDRFGYEAKGAIRDRERASMGIHPQGPEAPFTWPGSESNDGHGQSPHTSIYRLVPSMQSYRNNLTALSQAYNLYFVAYQGQIFVYVPRSVPKQRIPKHPDVQLNPGPSKVSDYIGGCADRLTPHTINHVLTGFLGKEEVLVACFDDGDVIAYYVKDIADYISSTTDLLPTKPANRKRNHMAGCEIPPRLFFHENVGNSAWGLAVHRQSRLIAVSSNRCEVVVFAFALAACQRQRQDARKPCEGCEGCDSSELGIRRRAWNWRIVVALGQHASNVPNVSFMDDDNGQAEKICAVDIKGAIWLADIWKTLQPVTRIPPSTYPAFQSEEYWPAASRGWGVLALAEENFMQVDTVEEMLGVQETSLEFVHPSFGCSQHMLNIQECMKGMPENPCNTPPARIGGGPFNPQILNGPQNGPLHILLGTLNANNMPVGGVDDSGDEFDDSEEESEDPGEEDESEEGSAEEDGMEEEEEEEEEEDEEEEDEEEDGDDGEAEEEAPANQNVAMILFPPQNTNLPPSQALQDLDDTLVELIYAVEGFQEVLSAPATPISGLSQGRRVMGSAPSIENGQNIENLISSRILFGASTPRLPPVRLDMAFFPHNGRIQTIPRRTRHLVGFLQRSLEYNSNKANCHGDKKLGQMSSRYRFLRAYEKDLELRSLQDESDLGPRQREMGIICPHALTLGGFSERTIRPYFRATSRLSFIAHIPELSLVVVGSPIGRVLLLTPTKLRSRIEKRSGFMEHGFRVECVLPRRADEQIYRTVKRPLHGMAIGPVQDENMMGSRTTNMASAPRRYRLMLHYRTHDILTYEITRENETRKLCIF